MRRKGKQFMVMKHTPDTAKLLNNLGYEVPSPILYRYDWADQTPFDSQRDTAAMLTMNRRAYVLNEMGTGKSLAALFAFDHLKQMGAANKMLIVAPLSTLNTVWANEIFHRMPHLQSVVLHGTRKKRVQLLEQDADIYIINHDGLKVLCDVKRTKSRSYFKLGPELEKRDDIDTVLLDELALYRNRRTDRWKSASVVINGRKWAWGMTGGPIPRVPTDAWGQVKLLTPENTTPDFRSFQDEIMAQVNQFKWVPRKNATKRVYEIMQPSVRFTRKDCLDLPPTTYSEREAALTPEQTRAYKQMMEEFTIRHPAGTVTAMNAGVQMSKLLQVVTGFAYDQKHRVIPLDHTPRMQLVREIVEEAAAKVIIFVPFKEALRLVEAGLQGHATTATVSGDTPKGERDTIFTQFQHSGNPQVLIAHPKVAAHGLTLTAADTVLWYAPLPDLEIYEQANARVPRPGQSLHTHIIHIVSTKTERKIINTLKRRGDIQNCLLQLFETNKPSLLGDAA